MSISDLSIRRPVFATVISLLLMVLGVMAFSRLTLRELPAIDPPIVSVDVTYLGASAAVVETRVTQVLEDALSGIEGIETLQSRSVNGRSSVTLEFTASRDIEAAANDVRDAISSVAGRMPEEADPPEVEKADSDSDTIMWLNMSSTTMDTLQLSDYADRYVVDRLSSLDGVARVQIGGQQRYAMRIWLDSAAMAARDITALDIENALRAENVELPAGRIESEARDFTLRVARGYEKPADFAQIPIKEGEGRLRGAHGRCGPGRTGLGRTPRLLQEQRPAQHRPGHHQDLHRQRAGRDPGRAGGRGGNPEIAAAGHQHLRGVRLDGVHRRRGRPRVLDAGRGHRAGAAGDLAVPGAASAPR